jgi:hypothetical protein
MTSRRLLRYPILSGVKPVGAILAGAMVAGVCLFGLAGASTATAQFLPGPGQSTPPAQFPSASAQSSVFPPPPGQAPAQRAQDPAFPPPPGAARQAAPVSGGFGPAPQGGFGPAPRGGFGPAPQGGFSAPAQGGFGAAPGSAGPSEAQRVCSTFPSLREDVEKGAMAIKTAGEKKVSREQVCPLFKSFAAKEAKMVKFLETNRTLCGVPPKVITQIKTSHANTIRIRNQVCSAAPAAGPAAAPTLSDALGGPLIADDESARRPGRGTFDTLTGNVLSR